MVIMSTKGLDGDVLGQLRMLNHFAISTSREVIVNKKKKKESFLFFIEKQTSI